MLSKYDTRFTVEECYSLHIRELADLGMFYKNLGKINQIMLERETGSLFIWARTKVDWQGVLHVDVTFPWNPNTVPRENEFDYFIETQSTKCPNGGSRLFFLCPKEKEGGKLCNKRVSVLYLPPGEEVLGCRECYGLTYKSTRKKPVICSPDGFINVGNVWQMDYYNEFKKLKTEYGIGGSGSVPINLATGSVMPRNVNNTTENVIYSLCQSIGMSEDEINEMFKRAETSSLLIEK